MAEKITLGGERLGSGDKIQVKIPEFNRSSHDQGRVFTTDMGFGMLVPAFCEVGLRGDVFYFNDIEALVRTLPTNGPVFGSIKMQVDVFQAPIRLYVGPLHNNATGIGLKMKEVKLPLEKHVTTFYQSDTDQANPATLSVSPSSLSHYLGQKSSPKGADWGNSTYYTNALHKLMYWDVYKNYYANKQEEEGVVIEGVGKTRTFPNEITGVLRNYKNGAKTSESSIQDGQFTSSNSIPMSYGINYAEKDRNKLEGTYLIILKTPAMKAIEEQQGKKALQDMITENVFLKDTLYSMEGMFVHRYDQEQAINGETLTWMNFGYAKADDDNFTTESGYYVIQHTFEALTGEIASTRFPLKNIDTMREAILAQPIGVPLVINKAEANWANLPYTTETEQIDQNGMLREGRSQTFCGLGIKTHLSDIYNNWLQTEWLDGDNGINELTAIDTTGGSFTVNEFILDYKLFKMMNRIAISDGSYDAWQTAVYGEEGRVMTESPVYCGGFSTEIGFDEVVSSSATTEEPLGSLAGRGASLGKTKKGGRDIKIKCDEATLVMVIVSFTPRVTYDTNEAWWSSLETMDDFHKPDLDGIAFQNLTQGQMAKWADYVGKDGSMQHRVVGKQTSWIEYTTAVNETHGNFVTGGSLSHMVLNRSYYAGKDGEIDNATTYIDPTIYNNIFADKTLANAPFWVQIGFNETTRRKMAAQQVPLM